MSVSKPQRRMISAKVGLELTQQLGKVGDSFLQELREVLWRAEESAQGSRNTWARVCLANAMTRRNTAREHVLERVLDAVCASFMKAAINSKTVLHGAIWKTEDTLNSSKPDGAPVLVRDAAYNTENREPHVKRIDPSEMVSFGNKEYPKSHAVAYRCFTTCEPQCITSVKKAMAMDPPQWIPLYAGQEVKYHSMVALPVWIRPSQRGDEEAVAVFSLDSNQEYFFAENGDWFDLLQPFVRWIAICYEMYQMLRNLHSGYLDPRPKESGGT